jgi:hypothetical protein
MLQKMLVDESGLAPRPFLSEYSQLNAFVNSASPRGARIKTGFEATIAVAAAEWSVEVRNHFAEPG